MQLSTRNYFSFKNKFSFFHVEDLKSAMDSKNINLTDLIDDISQRQDKNSFAKLFNYFAPRLKNYFYKLGVNESGAEEIVQDVMLAVWTKAITYDKEKSSLSTWIFTIARNKRIDRIRKEKRHVLVNDDNLLEIPIESSQEKEIYDIQLKSNFAELIKSLPKNQAKLIKLAYFNEKTHTKISEELNLPLGTVKSRIRLALTKIRNIIEV